MYVETDTGAGVRGRWADMRGLKIKFKGFKLILLLNINIKFYVFNIVKEEENEI